jgi:carotenoid cleavage dioxygenase
MNSPTNVMKYDMQTGVRTTHDFGPNIMSGEPVFVPASDAAGEDEGYLVTYLYDTSANSSSFVVLDAADMNAAPIATVPLPQRIPHGFHGSWFADE